MSEQRRTWKTFYIERRNDYRAIQAVWGSWPRSQSSHQMLFEGAGCIQTNVPLRELRDLFRIADARWRDYVSDVKQLTDEEGV